MTYRVTVDDIKKYVASVPDGVEVGVPDSRYRCLVAMTLKHKYPDKTVEVMYANRGARVAQDPVPFSSSVLEIAEEFDNLWNEDVVIITPEVLRERMPGLFEQEGE